MVGTFAGKDKLDDPLLMEAIVDVYDSISGCVLLPHSTQKVVRVGTGITQARDNDQHVPRGALVNCSHCPHFQTLRLGMVAGKERRMSVNDIRDGV